FRTACAKTSSAQEMSHQSNILVSHMPSLPCERASRPWRRQAACCSDLYSNAVDEVFTLQPPTHSAARLGCLARTADNRRTSCAAPTSLREANSPQRNIFRVRYTTGVRDQETLD